MYFQLWTPTFNHEEETLLDPVWLACLSPLALLLVRGSDTYFIPYWKGIISLSRNLQEN